MYELLNKILICLSFLFEQIFFVRTRLRGHKLSCNLFSNIDIIDKNLLSLLLCLMDLTKMIKDGFDFPLILISMSVNELKGVSQCEIVVKQSIEE